MKNAFMLGINCSFAKFCYLTIVASTLRWYVLHCDMYRTYRRATPEQHPHRDMHYIIQQAYRPNSNV